MLGTRVLVILVVLPPVLVLAYLGGPWLLALVLLATVGGIVELAGILTRAGLPGFWPAAYAAGCLLVLDRAFPSLGIGWATLGALVLLGLVRALFQHSADGAGLETQPAAVAGWAATVAAPLYVGMPLGLAYQLRLFEDGLGPVATLAGLELTRGHVWIALALALTFSCDSAAYLVGRFLGRRPLLPRISPKKTVEGTAAGVVGAAAATLLLAPLLDLGIGWALLIGLAGGAAAILGDLAESLLKRAAGVKDSGRLFPGHGGLLDRLDSLLFVFVVVYFGGTLARAIG
jgi:phosphatidate cytidylyltransferase